VYYYNGAQRYEQFLQVDCPYEALILLDLALLSSVHLCIFDFCGAIYIVNLFWLHIFLYLLVSLSLVGLALTWLTNHCPSVL